MQVHTISINPDTGEAKILLVGVKDPLVTTVPPEALQAVLEGVAAAVLQTMLPGYKPAPKTPQAPQRRAPARRQQAVVEDPDDDPVDDEGYDFSGARDDIEQVLVTLFDDDYEIEVQYIANGDDSHINVKTTSPSGVVKGASLTYQQWLIDGATVRPFIAAFTGRSL